MNPSTLSQSGALNGDTASLLSQLYPGQNQQQPTAAPTPTAQSGAKPNFFERILPTAGSILGGIGGSFVSPFLGSAAGAAAGDAAGKFLENKLTGQAGGNGVAQSAVEGGVGQIGGNVLGGVLKGGANLLGGLADKGATKLVQGQFAKGALSGDTAQALNSMGITNADQVGQIAPLITGSNGALANGVRRGLGEADMGVDVTGLDQIANNTLAEQGASPRAIKAVGQNLTNATNNMVPGDVATTASKGGGSTSYSYTPGALRNALPENVFNQTQRMETLAKEASNKAFDNAGNVTNTDEYAKFKTYQTLAGELRSRAFGGDTPIPLSEENKSQIISDLSPLQQINPQAHNYHVGQVTNAQNLQDLRPIQAPMVQANQALTATANAADRAGGATTGSMVKTIAPLAGSMTAGTPGLVGGLALSALGTKAADKVGASTLSKVSDLLTNPAMQKAVQAAAPVATQTVANAPNYAATGGSMLPQTPGMTPMGAQAGGMPGQQQMSPNLLALQSGLLGLQDPYLASGYSPLVQAALPDVQKATAANAALQALESTYQQAGGGQGLIPGLLSRLGGMVTGGPAAMYGAQAGQLQHTLQSEGLPVSAIPGLTSTGAASQAGFSTLQQIINSLGGQSGALLGGLPTGQ